MSLWSYSSINKMGVYYYLMVFFSPPLVTRFSFPPLCSYLLLAALLSFSPLSSQHTFISCSSSSSFSHLPSSSPHFLFHSSVLRILADAAEPLFVDGAKGHMTQRRDNNSMLGRTYSYRTFAPTRGYVCQSCRENIQTSKGSIICSFVSIPILFPLYNKSLVPCVTSLSVPL